MSTFAIIMIVLAVLVLVGVPLLARHFMSSASAPSRTELEDEDTSRRGRQFNQVWALSLAAGLIFAGLVALVRIWVEFTLWLSAFAGVLAALGVLVVLLITGFYQIPKMSVAIINHLGNPRWLAGDADGWAGSRHFFRLPWERVGELISREPQTKDFQVHGNPGAGQQRQGILAGGSPWFCDLGLHWLVVDVWKYAVRHQGCERGEPLALVRLRQYVEGFVPQVLANLRLEQIAMVQSVLGSMVIQYQNGPAGGIVVCVSYNTPPAPPTPTGLITEEERVLRDLEDLRLQVVSLVGSLLQRFLEEAWETLGIQVTRVDVQDLRTPDPAVQQSMRAFQSRLMDLATAATTRAVREAEAAGDVLRSRAQAEIARALQPGAYLVLGGSAPPPIVGTPPATPPAGGGGGGRGGGRP